MRIVLDMQGAQSNSRFRGIGRYTLSLAEALVRNRGEHEIILVLNGLLGESIIPIRERFKDLLPQENIRVWYSIKPITYKNEENTFNRKTAELVREAFLASLQPDLIHIFSLFEGYADNAVTSIGLFDTGSFVSTTFFDLIPLLNPEKYLDVDPVYNEFYKEKIEYLKKANQLITISEYSKNEAIEHLRINEASISNCYLGVDDSFEKIEATEKETKVFLEKWGIHQSFLLYSGGSDERKNLARLIEAYTLLDEKLRNSHQLVLTGSMDSDNVNSLNILIDTLGLEKNKIIFTDYVSDQELNQLYNLCTLFVFPSIHEGFGLPIIEAMKCGTPVIASNTSSLPEVMQMEAALFDPFNTRSISDKISEALTDQKLLKRLKENAEIQCKKFSWNNTAACLLEQLNELNPDTKTPETIETTLNSLITRLSEEQLIQKDHLPELAYSLEKTFVDMNKPKQLFIDISELVQRDMATGIQRVTKGILNELVNNPPENYLVQPVYATVDDRGYRYANKFLSNMYGTNGSMNDTFIEFKPGDIFLGLDLQHHTTRVQEKYLTELSQYGVKIYFVIYDMLPILFPQFWPAEHLVNEIHEEWLTVISKYDGALCISRSVAEQFSEWLAQQDRSFVKKSFSVDWFHLGADIANTPTSSGMPKNAETILADLKAHTSFLMVGTIEPRKAYAQTLQAFEQLWDKGLQHKLVIVGKSGWLVDSLLSKLRQHPQLNKNLYWLEGISDEFLEQIYASSSCLIAASYGEGFGLPLIEAAQHHIPIIARDIPVFREVAGDHAYFFPDTQSPDDIATAVIEWDRQHQNGQHPKSDTMPWLNWHESAQQLLKVLLHT